MRFRQGQIDGLDTAIMFLDYLVEQGEENARRAAVRGA